MDVKVSVSAVPDAVKLRHVPRFKYDSEKPDDPPILDGEDTPTAESCYVFEADDGKRQYLNADEASVTWAALAPETEDEDMGAVVGELFKLDPRDCKIKWAGEDGSVFPIRQKQLDRLTSNCTLIEENR